MTKRRVWCAAAVAAATVLAACSGSGQGSAGTATTNQAVDRAAPTAPVPPGSQVSSDVSTASAAPSGAESSTSAVDRGSEWFCGGFGAEEPPVLLALDRSEATPRWRRCTDPGFVQSFGRADGATLLVRQQNSCTSLVAIDDEGEERWHAVTDPYRGGTYVVGDVVVTTTSDAVAVDAVTGEELWRHGLGEGTPIGSTNGLLIEAAGTPYDGSPAGPPAPGTLRGVDPHSGTAVWTTPVELVSVPAPSQYSPTVGAGVIAISDSAVTPRSTLIDAATGTVLGTHDGVLVATPSGVVVYDQPGRAAALVEPRTGERLALDGTTPVWFAGGDPGTTPDAGVLVATEPATGPTAELRMLEVPGGAVRWRVPYRTPLARDATSVLVGAGHELISLDAADGSELWRYRAPTDLVEYAAGTIGDDVVIVMPQWTGSGRSPRPPQPGALDDCGGTDPVAANASCADGLETAAGASSDDELIVAESADGSIFCVSIGGSEPLVHPVPASPGNRIRFEGSYPTLDEDRAFDSVLYVFAMPGDSPREVEVLDEEGRPMPSAVGPSGRFLVVFQAEVGASGEGASEVSRRVRIVDPSGAELAEVEFPGFSERSGATYQEFVACVEGTGMTMPLPPGGPAPSTSSVGATIDELSRAWSACADVFLSMMRVSQSGSDRFFENLRAQYDCEAEAGWFTPINGHPTTETAAHADVYLACALRSPANAALIACFRANGLDAAARAPGEPFPTEAAGRAWAACRGEYAEWVDGGGGFDRVLATYDCAAAQGWILPLLSAEERTSSRVRDVERAC